MNKLHILRAGKFIATDGRTTEFTAKNLGAHNPAPRGAFVVTSIGAPRRGGSGIFAQ